MSCPLCKSSNLSFIEKINKDDIYKIYLQQLNIDTSRLIQEDIDFYSCLNCFLKFYSPMITGDEFFYNQLQKFDWYYSDFKSEFNYASSLIEEHDCILEVGCGKGAFSRVIPSVKYTGLDFSINAKKMAETQGLNIENTSIQEFSKNNVNQFDVVCSFQVLEHVAEIFPFIQSQLDCLKKDGKLIISVPSEDSVLAKATNNPLNMPPHHLSRWSDKTLEFIASHFNLTLEVIHHESIQPEHKIWYLNTLIKSKIIKGSTINHRFIERFTSKILNVMLLPISKLIPIKKSTFGHTVTAVYSK